MCDDGSKAPLDTLKFKEKSDVNYGGILSFLVDAQLLTQSRANQFLSEGTKKIDLTAMCVAYNLMIMSSRGVSLKFSPQEEAIMEICFKNAKEIISDNEIVPNLFRSQVDVQIAKILFIVTKDSIFLENDWNKFSLSIVGERTLVDHFLSAIKSLKNTENIYQCMIRYRDSLINSENKRDRKFIKSEAYKAYELVEIVSEAIDAKKREEDQKVTQEESELRSMMESSPDMDVLEARESLQLKKIQDCAQKVTKTSKTHSPLSVEECATEEPEEENPVFKTNTVFMEDLIFNEEEEWRDIIQPMPPGQRAEEPLTDQERVLFYEIDCPINFLSRLLRPNAIQIMVKSLLIKNPNHPIGEKGIPQFIRWERLENTVVIPFLIQALAARRENLGVSNLFDDFTKEIMKNIALESIIHANEENYKVKNQIPNLEHLVTKLEESIREVKDIAISSGLQLPNTVPEPPALDLVGLGAEKRAREMRVKALATESSQNSGEHSPLAADPSDNEDWRNIDFED